MAETVSILVGHPWLVGFLTISLLVFAGQTYDFILKLVGRSDVHPKPTGVDGGWGGGTDEGGPFFPPEPSNVPIPGQPDGLIGENGIPGDQPQEYVFSGEGSDGGHWAGSWGGGGNKGDRPYITSEDGDDNNDNNNNNNGKDE